MAGIPTTTPIDHIRPGDTICWEDGTANAVTSAERDMATGFWVELQLDTGDVLRFSPDEYAVVISR